MEAFDQASSIAEGRFDTASWTDAVECPRCGEPLWRVRHRAHDRLLDLLRPAYRFRCYNLPCQWEGRRSNRDALMRRGKSFLPRTPQPAATGEP